MATNSTGGGEGTRQETLRLRAAAAGILGWACAGLLFLMAAVLLSACTSEQPDTVPIPAPRATPTPESTAAPAAISTPGPTTVPVPTSAPTPTTVPTPTNTPAAMATPTPTPGPTPTPTQTPAEAAEAELAQIIAWFASPPDASHAEAATVLTDNWVRDADLGIMTAREPWVGDGVTGSEARVLTLLRNIASADAEIAKRAAASMLSAEGVAEQHVLSLERFFQTVVLPRRGTRKGHLRLQLVRRWPDSSGMGNHRDARSTWQRSSTGDAADSPPAMDS